MIKRHSVQTDISYISMLVLFFLGVLFMANDNVNFAFNSGMLCLTITILILTYFTSMWTGLICQVVVIFLLVAYTLFRSLSAGITVEKNTYFWILWPISMIVATAIHVKAAHDMGEENLLLHSQLQKFATIDELTQMNNLLAYETDAKVYMKMSKRYHMNLVLVLWRLSFQEELESIVGAKEFNKVIEVISDTIKNSLRTEDLVYLLDKSPYMWGVLLFTKADSISIVLNNVQNRVEQINMLEFTNQKAVPLELTTGFLEYDEGDISPLMLLDETKRQMQIFEREDNEDE